MIVVPAHDVLNREMSFGGVIKLCDRSCIHRWINLLNTHIIQSPKIIVGDAIVELSPLQEKQEKIRGWRGRTLKPSPGDTK